jgi:hypothetical protein
MNTVHTGIVPFDRGYRSATGIVLRFMLLAALSLAASASAADDVTHPQAETLRQALAEMVQQQRDPFVVVEIVESKQFFQYMAGETGYVFDVPAVTLTERQFSRARAYFEPRGVYLNRYANAEPGAFDRAQYVFQRELANDQLDEGIALGLGFLTEVLDAGDHALVVLRGWQ